MDGKVTFLQLSSGCLKLLRCKSLAKFCKKCIELFRNKLRMNKSASGKRQEGQLFNSNVRESRKWGNLKLSFSLFVNN